MESIKLSAIPSMFCEWVSDGFRQGIVGFAWAIAKISEVCSARAAHFWQQSISLNLQKPSDNNISV
jgi:hypothetical protein